MNERVLRVAAVQMQSLNGDPKANLERAEHWVREAASKGAQLVLLPELFSTGFEFVARAWKQAEAQGGPSERWLRAIGRRYGVHIGGSYMEVRGEDFFNTFALATPAGEIAGRVRKSNPCSLEAYVFKAAADHHVIPTDIGRIGVSICYEGTLRATWEDLFAGAPDLVLMPASAPTPMKTWFYSQRQIEAFHAVLRDSPAQSAANTGIPTIMANKCGAWEADLPSFWPKQTSRFCGFSRIADSDGREVARLDDGEGVIVGDVHLVPARKKLALAPEVDRYKPWIFDPPKEYKLFPFIEALGRRWYRKHPERCGIARSRAGS